ncbi:MAG: carbon starvation protein A [Bacteroidales bacterium]|nr:carbon starvation protein A [Bacteroidales bacterium]
MYSFIISLAALALGYLIFGRYVEKVFRPNRSAITPAYSRKDGIDYVPMPSWKVYMIQFLNIAGTGPIFGAIMGAQFGPSCYVWIVMGCLFAGAVHDYFCGMLSIRNGGAGLPDIVGKYLGSRTRIAVLVLSIVLLLLVGTVFVYSPAMILGQAVPLSDTGWASVMIWVAIVFGYYILATLLPVDKIIGKIYPLFAFALLFMALSLGVCLFVKWPSLPEIWDGTGNMRTGLGLDFQPIFPCLFVTVACGAISGFHATQSPIMARCAENENKGRQIFFGSMVTEGAVALIWAAISSYFFFGGGKEALGVVTGQAPEVVAGISKAWLGVAGGIMSILGIVAAPITSGDTAFRSARLIIADFLHLNQQKKVNRLVVAIPIFAAVSLLLWYNIKDEQGFNTIWRYFGWANQTLACFMLWAATAYLTHRERHRLKRYHLMTLIPACFMTSVCVTYICVDKIGFHLPASVIPWIGTLSFVAALAAYYVIRGRWEKQGK